MMHGQPSIKISNRFVLVCKTKGYIDASLLSYNQLAIQDCGIVLFSQKAMMEAVVLHYYYVNMYMTGELQGKKPFGRHLPGWEGTVGFAFAL
jgi:hypothetical protein